MAKIVQTAGRDNLGDFAPQFAHFNDDILFGEEWNNEDITAKTRSIITISVFMGRGLVDSSLKAHLQIGRKNGITKKEITALITHAAFYAGWPVAWAVFNMAKEIWADDSGDAGNGNPELSEYAKTIFFPVGEPNDAYAQYFDGNSYLAPIEAEGVAISNVTFEPGCRNHWHIHRASQGGGQMLIAVWRTRVLSAGRSGACRDASGRYSFHPAEYQALARRFAEQLVLASGIYGAGAGYRQ